VHTIGELERVLKLELDPARVLLGINNRDLSTFEVTLENTRIIMASPAGQQVEFSLSFQSVNVPQHVNQLIAASSWSLPPASRCADIL